VPLIAAASHGLFGMALLPLRLVPALSMAATVGISAEFARLLSGGRFAQWLSGLAVLLGGVFLVDGLLLTTDMMQPLTWLGCSWCLVKLAQTKDERWWLGFGFIAGISLLSKYLILFYLAGLAAGILLTPLRRSLLRPQIYLGAMIAFAFLAPSAWWQASHGWPFLEIGRAGVNTNNLVLLPLGFFAQQVLFVGPAAALIWLAGLWRLSVRPGMPELRVFPIAYAVMVVLFFLLHGKAYYLAPVYPVLLAAGSVAMEGWFRWSIVRGVVLVLVAGTGLLLAPLALPVLPPDRYTSYARALGIPAGASATENGKHSALPLHLSGMFGWPELAGKVTAIYRALPENERENAVFFGRNYGEAAAVSLYGNLPSVSGYHNFYLWPPRDHQGDIVITLGGDVTQLMRNYRRADVVGHINNRYALPYETDVSIYVLRDPRVPLSTLWPQLRYYE
jgi:4-amino-4-deoxy-L-arabinose transferase-like glycosyltransferase